MLWSWVRAWSAPRCICSSEDGHQHHGLTPATGRLLAEMMTGQAPFTDPGPYAV
jgi:hypothetical protein